MQGKSQIYMHLIEIHTRTLSTLKVLTSGPPTEVIKNIQTENKIENVLNSKYLKIHKYNNVIDI